VSLEINIQLDSYGLIYKKKPDAVKHQAFVIVY